MNASLCVNNIYKSFKIGRKSDPGFLFYLLSLISGKEAKRNLDVLEDISFSAYPGEVIGIIGMNGSGKSTLLKIIAGIYQSDQGFIKTNGELVYVSGYGQGIKNRLTMRDNIFLVGSIMGLSSKEINNRFNEIVEFSGLGEFLDTKIYHFSSGMINRLSFSISINCLEQKNPDILLLDEVFGGGGDLAFNHKAISRMSELTFGGSIVIMVSHDLNIISKYCNRAVLLHKNRKHIEGAPDKVIAIYKDLIKEKNKQLN